MNKDRILILTAQQIELKIRRMAFEIWERFSDENEVLLIGIKVGGAIVAHKIAQVLKEICELKIEVKEIEVNKKNPLQDNIIWAEDLNNLSIVLIDDVANSGQTLLYALKPMLNYIPKQIIIAALLDRTHKSFPIKVDIVGHALATTLQDEIRVELVENQIIAAYLI